MAVKPEIPDFKLVECCGSGAYGDVWIALDHNGMRRAVKVLDKMRLKNLGALAREEKALHLFRTQVPKHPNLIDVLHVGETEDFIFYVMELADNFNGDGSGSYVADTLEIRIRKNGALSPESLPATMDGICAAAEAIHAAGLVHRDIKPSNIIFVGSSPRLADIGLTASDSPGISIAGTADFMPPERTAGTEADIYSLGKLLYCAFTGFGPEKFPSLPEDFRLLPSNRRREIEKFNRVSLAACARNPAERLKTVAEFRDALRGGSLRGGGRRRRAFTRILRYAAVPAAVAGATVWLIFRQGDSAPPERTQLMRLADVELQRWHPDVALVYLDKVRLKWQKWADKDEKYFKLRDSAEIMKKKMAKAGGEAVMKTIIQASTALGSDPKRALELMEKLWKDPASRKQARVISLYAMALAANDRFGEAVETMKLQTKLPDPEDADGGYAGLAELYEKKEMFKEALENLDLLISKHPDSRVYLNQKAMVCVSANDTEGALAVYRRMLEITPDDEDIKDMIKSLEDTMKEVSK